MPDELMRDAFARHVGTRFELGGPAEAVALELVEVRELGAAAADPGRSFALLFRGPRHKPLRQGTYQLRHHSIGEVALFLVPVGVDGGGTTYEAVFNRLPPR